VPEKLEQLSENSGGSVVSDTFLPWWRGLFLHIIHRAQGYLAHLTCALHLLVVFGLQQYYFEKQDTGETDSSICSCVPL
jgi:hypothetical protein